jgi:hypothetical protein
MREEEEEKIMKSISVFVIMEKNKIKLYYAKKNNLKICVLFF